jgi:magnesium transporter
MKTKNGLASYTSEKAATSDMIYELDALRNKDFEKIIRGMDNEVVAKLLREGEIHFCRRIFACLNDERLIKVFKHLKVDDITDNIGYLKTVRRKSLLDKFSSQYAATIIQLLGYDAESAGGIMTTEYITVPVESTIFDVYQKVRDIGPVTEVIDEIYVVDPANALLGKLNIRALFMFSNTDEIKYIMEKDVLHVSPHDDRENVAIFAANHNLLYVPVVDRNNVILGVITSDDILDNMYLEQNEEVLNLGGVINNGSLDTSLKSSLIKRLPWLFVNLFSVFIAAFVISMFDNEIERFVGLAMAMPVIAGMGGNSGNQVLAITIRSIALGRSNLKEHWTRLFGEILIAVINGTLLGLIAAGLFYIKYNSIKFSVVILISMICNFILANSIGLLFPMILKGLKIDPTSGSSILLTAFTDSMGFLIFLSLSKLLLNLV